MPTLGRDHEVPAFRAALQPVANDRFRFPASMSGHPPGIDICGVDEVESRTDQGIQDRKRRGLGRSPSKYITAETERCNPQTGAA